MTIPARVNTPQQLGYLRRRVAFNTPGVAGGIPIGAVPAGARLLQVAAYVATAFNAGTTNTVNLGTTAAGSEVMASATIIPGTAGYKEAPAASLTTEFLTDTTIYANFVQAGTPATAGAVDFVITYAPNL
jgi:hypothetical protein